MYASPRASERKDLWLKLDIPLPGEQWLVTGDFNFVLKGDEWSSGTWVSDSFVNCVGAKATD